MPDRIYLDHAATTPVDPRVLEVMLPFFGQRAGNPSSLYTEGQDARAALDWARGLLAERLNCRPAEIIFTSGATEANNLAIKGIAEWQLARAETGMRHIVISAVEHPAVLQTVASLALYGFEATLVQPDTSGIVSAVSVEAALRADTCLVSVMYANNEIGTIQPVTEIATIARARGIPFHTDAVQAAGTLPLDVETLGVDLLSLSAHKFYGPKGIGLLYVRQNTPLRWQQHGGGQEGGRRGGTENVPAIVGMAAALAMAEDEAPQRNPAITELRDHLITQLLERIPDATVNGHVARRLPNNVNLSFAGVDGATLLLSLDMHGVAASSGSACSTGSTEPSHVLRALGLSDPAARGSLRLTLGKDTTRDEIDRAIAIIVNCVEMARR